MLISRRIAWPVLFALLLAAIGLPHPIHAQPDRAAWTIMFYMTADTSDIEDAMLLDVNEIEWVGSTDQVNLIAQVDRTEDDPSWTDTRRFRLTRDADWENINSPVLQALGEVNQGDPAALVDFARWTVQNYPADRYALILSDHGGGWTGFGWDQTSGDDPLTLPELDRAFAQITALTGGPLALVGFDACLLSQLEVVKTLAPYADFALLSEELVPGYGFAYDHTLPALIENPALNAAELGRRFVDDYVYSYAEGEWQDEGETKYDLGVIALGQVPPIDSALDQFVSAVQSDPGGVLSALGVARNNALTFSSDTPDDEDYFSSVDLIDFLTLLIDQSGSPSVTQAAQALIDASRQSVLYHAASPALADSHGIAIYFPRNQVVYDDWGGSVDYVQQVPQMAAWQTFLSVFYGTAAATIPPDSVSDAEAVAIQAVYPTDTVSIHQPPVLSFNTNAQHILKVTFSATLQLDNGTRIMLDESDLESAEIDTSGEPLIDFPDGYQEHEFTWGVEMPVITDGVISVPTLLIPDRQDPTAYLISGQYTGQDGHATTAYLSLDPDRGTVTNIWGVLQMMGNHAPFNIHPQPGDTFLPTWRYLDEQGNYKIVPASTAPLTFGSAPFTYHYEPAVSGTYVLTIRLEDVAGNVYTSSTTVTVDNEGLDMNYRGYTDVALGINFLYPWDWPEPTYYDQDDGSLETVISDADETITIYLTTYDAASDEDLYATALDYLDQIENVTYSEDTVEDVTVYGYEGSIIPYTYEIDGASYVGALLAVYVPDLETGYLVDLDAVAAKRDEGTAVFNVLIGSLNFFTPPEG